MKIVKNILLFSIAVVFVLILSEFFIRFSHLANVSSTEFYEDIGRGKRKNFNYVYFNEGFGIGNFNEHRFLGPSVPLIKESNTIRIALLGDSYIEAFHIFERDYFGTILRESLSAKYPSKKIEILNFGRSGFDIADEYALHQKMVKKFDPNFILYFISNDDLKPRYSDVLRPKTLIKNDSLIVSMKFSEQKLNIFQKTKFLTQNSTILNMLNNGRQKAKGVSVLQIILDKVYYWFRPDFNVSQGKILRENFKLNPVSKKIIQKLDNKIIIVVNKDTKELPKEVKQLIDSHQIMYFDLGKSIDSLKQSGTDPFFWKVTKQNGHWNKHTHRLIAIELESMLVDRLK